MLRILSAVFIRTKNCDFYFTKEKTPGIHLQQTECTSIEAKFSNLSEFK